MLGVVVLVLLCVLGYLGLRVMRVRLERSLEQPDGHIHLVCRWCFCVFDARLGHRVWPLSRSQAQQLELRGTCATCAAVKAKVTERNEGGVS